MSINKTYSLIEFDAKDGSSQNANYNKQAWLSFLEKNGLNEALAKFEVLKNNEKMSNQASTQFDIRSNENLSQKDSNFEKALQPGLKKSIEPVQNRDSSNSGRITVLNYSEDQSSLSASNSLVMLEKKSNQENIAPFPEVNVRDKARLIPDSKKYLTQNMVFSRTELGVELWIRDAGLSKPNLMVLLKDLKASMSQLGASLVKVSLNGQQYFTKQKV